MPDSPVKPVGLYEQIYIMVRRVPAGRVTTYGQIAKLTGGCTARQVGYAMAALPYETDVPWHRVINSRGQISMRKGSDGHDYQRILLEEEGIIFDRLDKIDLTKFAWPGPGFIVKQSSN